MLAFKFYKGTRIEFYGTREAPFVNKCHIIDLINPDTANLIQWRLETIETSVVSYRIIALTKRELHTIIDRYRVNDDILLFLYDQMERLMAPNNTTNRENWRTWDERRSNPRNQRKGSPIKRHRLRKPQMPAHYNRRVNKQTMPRESPITSPSFNPEGAMSMINTNAEMLKRIERKYDELTSLMTEIKKYQMNGVSQRSHVKDISYARTARTWIDCNPVYLFESKESYYERYHRTFTECLSMNEFKDLMFILGHINS